MLVTISTTAEPATNLGFLLHKHPEKVQSFPVAAGTAHVFYPEATPQRCTAALLLEVDPVALVRRPRTGSATLGQYVNDRPYAASSMLAVALARVFGTAMAGRCTALPEAAAAPLPLELHVPALPCRGGAELAGRMFAPMGWQVRAEPVPLDPELPEWGDSPFVDLRLTGTMRLAEALGHLYVLLPVLDDTKHYWVSDDEVEKLLRVGARWLAAHPERELITRRYLAHQPALHSAALARLAEVDDVVPDDQGDGSTAPRPLVEARTAAVLDALRTAGARTVADLGCGEGRLVERLLADPAYTRVLGTDVSSRALETAARRLARLAERQQERVELFQSSLVYTDARLAGLDAAVLMEVVEHVDPPRLPALARTVFGAARPATVVVTTPNAEHNVRYPGLAAGGFRHRDHRFEWTRAQFRAWVDAVAATYGYTVAVSPVGEDDPEVGPPTQMAVFSIAATGGSATA